MAQQHDDHLSGLERHTQILSDKSEELRASLFTFQRWYLDYLDLKEEVDAVSRSAAKTTTSPQPSAAQQRAVEIAASASTSALTSASTSPSPSSTATATKTSSNSDVDGTDPPGTRAGLARIRRDFQGAIITRADVADIFGRDIDQLRSLDHISSALGRRIDYVEQNVATLERLVAQAENKLAAARVVASPDFGIAADHGNGDDNDDGSRGGRLPITDIVETLDEDGNVVDFRLQTGGEAGKTLMEVLGRAGLKEFSEDVLETNKKMDSLAQERKALAIGPGAKNVPDPQLGAKTPEPAAASAEHPKLNKTVSFSEDTKPKHKLKKTVSFADDTRPGHELKKKVSFSQDTKPSRNDTRHGEQSSDGMKINERLVKLMEEARRQEAMDMSKALMPEVESAEDRELRRQMLEYSMSEIGPVVAELTIEDGDVTEGSDEDDLSWDDEDEDVDEDDSCGDAHEEEEEDETGRSKISVITSTYVRRMQELEKRLAVQTAFSATSSKQPFETSSRVLPSEKGGLVRIEVAEHQDTFAEKPTPPDASAPVAASLIDGGGKTKAVRFATQELHVAEEDVSSSAKLQPGSRSISADKAARSAQPVNSLGDVLERASGGSKASPQQHSHQQGINGDLEEAQPPKRVSRFKKAHMKENGNGHPSQQRQPAPPPQTPQPPSSAATAAAATGPAVPKSPLEMAAVLATHDATTAVPPAASAAPPDPTGPEGRTLADTVVERAMATAPRDPDDMDDVLLYRAAAVEYNVLRNRMIQRQGGFARPAGEEGEEKEMVMMARAGGEAEAAAAEEEEEEEQEEEQPRPMSRFRAARLARGL